MRRAHRRLAPAGANLGASLRALALRPGLWPTAVVASKRLVPSRWWTRPPFLPLPQAEYLRFRLSTFAGADGSQPAEPDALIEWLEWCRRWPGATAA